MHYKGMWVRFQSAAGENFVGFLTLYMHFRWDFGSAAGENLGILSLYTGVFKGDFSKKIWHFWDPSCPPLGLRPDRPEGGGQLV